MIFKHPILRKKFIHCNFQNSLVLDACVLQENGEKSICVLLEDCEAAKRALKQNKFPQHCGFVGNESIVCCPEYKKIKESLSTGDLARKGL